MGDMVVQTWPKGVSFEETWALIRETGQLIKELTVKTDRQQEEIGLHLKDTDRLIKELTVKTDQPQKETDRLQKETARQMKETDRRLGELGIRLGDLTEHFMAPKLHEKFQDRGFVFTRISRNVELEDPAKKRLTEIDVLLENGEYAMAVEVKTRLNTEDVQDHLKRMEILRRVADTHQDSRKYLGAVAGAVVNQEVIRYALKKGFYVIIPSGETVEIEAPQGFKPRIW
ncbi:MAG: hypothetical protein LBD93_02940 [Treponema sp.]|jgi:hypothetical protein|nr:hypothetical protein [Treponema sp.]